MKRVWKWYATSPFCLFAEMSTLFGGRDTVYEGGKDTIMWLKFQILWWQLQTVEGSCITQLLWEFINTLQKLKYVNHIEYLSFTCTKTMLFHPNSNLVRLAISSIKIVNLTLTLEHEFRIRRHDYLIILCCF